MKRILITGGRNYGRIVAGRPLEHPVRMKERRRLTEILDDLLGEFGPFQMIHGAARGADSLAEEWWQDPKGFRAGSVPSFPEPLRFPADWDDLSHPDACVRIAKGGQNKGKRFDANAGPRRNQKMIDEATPDLVVAFPGGAGTEDMIERAEKAGIDIRRID